MRLDDIWMQTRDSLNMGAALMCSTRAIGWAAPLCGAGVSLTQWWLSR